MQLSELINYFRSTGADVHTMLPQVYKQLGGGTVYYPGGATIDIGNMEDKINSALAKNPAQAKSPSQNLNNAKQQASQGNSLDNALSGLQKIDFKKVFDGPGIAIVIVIVILLIIFGGRR